MLLYLTKTAAGRKKVEEAIGLNVKGEAKKLADEVKAAQKHLPFSFGVKIGPIKFEPSTANHMQMSCGVDFDHEEATRPAFYDGGRWPDGDLIYLFEHGWSFESENPPRGMWHGHWTPALTEREGLHFVKGAVKSYMSSVPNGVDVEIAEEYL